eukprot:5639311-Prymnesium_polylepis.1
MRSCKSRSCFRICSAISADCGCFGPGVSFSGLEKASIREDERIGRRPDALRYRVARSLRGSLLLSVFILTVQPSGNIAEPPCPLPRQAASAPRGASL